jgi:hypothetical protein
MAKWISESTNGFSDEGPRSHNENFESDPLGYVGSEPVQNILDAVNPKLDLPARAVYCLEEWEQSEFPDLAGLRKHFENCKKSNKASKVTMEVCRKALKVLGKKYIPVLKIQDFNTTGVRGPVDERDSPWRTLVIATGDSKKTSAVDEQGALGSFGLGKYAPFVCSDLRTVLYSTKADDGNEAFQGVALIPSYQFGPTYKDTTQGRVLYGEKGEPLIGEKVPKKFKRTALGTDLYILGFNGDDDWEDEILESVVKKFFVGIYEGLLEVKVQNTSLTRSTLPPVMKRFAQETKSFKTDEYFKALTSDREDLHFFEDYADEKDALELFLLPGQQFHKRVAMVRRSGMTIYPKKFSVGPQPFSGVFIARGKEINSSLQRLEDATHESWKMKRDKKGPGIDAYRRVIEWVGEKINESLGFDLTESEDLYDTELTDIISIDDEESEAADSSKKESEEGTDQDRSGEGAEKGKVAEDTKVTIVPPKPRPLTAPDERKLKPGFPPEPGPEPGPGPNPDNPRPGPSDEPGPGVRKEVPLDDVRMWFRKETERWCVLLTPLETGTGYLAFDEHGDNIRESETQIKEFWVAGASTPQKPSKKGLGPVNLVKGERLQVEFVLRKARKSRLEVAAYED